MQNTAFRQLVAQLASHFAAGDTITPADLPRLTDDDLSVALNYEDGLLADGVEPSAIADILNSAVHTELAERTVALGEAVRAGLLHAARDYLATEVNDLLMMWEADRESDDEPMPETLSPSERAPAEFFL